MCKECGCGLPGDAPVRIGDDAPHEHGHDHVHGPGEHHGHSHAHPHGHPHSHSHSHPASGHKHEHGPGLHHTHDHEHEYDHDHEHRHDEAEPVEARRTVEVRRAILEKNDRLAERNRGFFRGRGLLVLNVLSSPGSGKTTLLCETARTLAGKLRMAVIVGDLATDNDARRLRDAGVPVVQIITGTVCHLEAEMVARSLGQVDLAGVELLVVENVGNLVCPASYDLGEDRRVVLFSVTEGEDKPLKYPPIFQSANLVIVSKMDLAGPCNWDREAALQNLRRVAPGAEVIELSAKTGQGMQAWLQYLLQRQHERSTSPMVP